MKINVKVHSNSSKEKVLKLNDKEYEVWLKDKPINGKANQKLVKLLKRSFKKSIKIVSGLKSRNKTIEIL